MLKNPLSTVEWMEKNERLDELLDRENGVTVQSMNQGYEAEVVRISSPRESFVLKSWNKGSKPDVQFQYRLLRVLAERGLSVSKPVGWGIQPNGDKAMLTTFDGMPIQELNDKKMTELAKVLSAIHQTRIDGTDHLQLPKYEFIDYFFPGIREHSDLYEALVSLVRKVSIKHDRVIHGDFHLANIVEDVDRYTVIDWTNGQWGDSRYDFAWSLALCRIYVSERFAEAFRSAYLLEHPIERSDLEVFEAIACLRWALLNRSGGVPKGPGTMDRVKKLIAGNPFLRESEFKDWPIKKKIRGDEEMNIDAAFGQFPILRSDEFTLKKIEEIHLEELFEIYDNDKVFEYCGIIPKHNKETVRSMIGHFERDYNKRSRIKWGIFANQAPDRLLGIIEAMDFNQKVNMVSVGYFLAESQWGKGIASKAVGMLLAFLFGEVNVNRIQAEVMPSNEPSKKVLLKNGFLKEGLLRQATLWSGKGVVDLEVYGILREDDIE